MSQFKGSWRRTAELSSVGFLHCLAFVFSSQMKVKCLPSCGRGLVLPGPPSSCLPSLCSPKGTPTLRGGSVRADVEGRGASLGSGAHWRWPPCLWQRSFWKALLVHEDGPLVGVSSVCGEGGVGGRAQRGQSPGEARERRHPQTWELGLALGWRR